MANRGEWLHVRVTAAELGSLGLAAEQRGVSRSELVRLAVSAFLAQWQQAEIARMVAEEAAEKDRLAKQAAEDRREAWLARQK